MIGVLGELVQERGYDDYGDYSDNVAALDHAKTVGPDQIPFSLFISNYKLCKTDFMYGL